MLDAQQVPGLRRQQGPLLRDEPAGRGAGAERRRQARADRLREDVLTVNRRDLIKRGLALAAWLAARQTAAAEASSTAFARLKAAVSGQAAPQPFNPEYIVVGSGAGGGTVAARLAESGFRVLLLEAGGDPRTLQGGDPQSPDRNTLPDDYDVPAFHPLATENEAMRWDFFVRHYEDDARQRRDPKFAPRSATRRRRRAVPARGHARRLHRAQRDDLRLPAQLRLEPARRPHRRPSWRADHMRTYFERIENCHHRRSRRFWSKLGINPSRHGWDGWLRPRRRFRSAAFADAICARRSSRPRRTRWREFGGPLGDRARSRAAAIRTTGASSSRRAPSVSATRR